MSVIPPDDRAQHFPVGAGVTVHELETAPRPALARLRGTEPVSWIPALDAWLVTRRDLAIAAMRDAEAFTVDDPRFTTAAVLGPSMLSLDGPEHERHRSPFAPSFRPGVVREHFAGFLADEVDALIASLDPADAELRTGLAGPLAVNTITRFLGLDGVTPAEVLDWYGSITRAITDLTLGHEIARDDAATVRSLHDRVQKILDGSAPDRLLKSIEAAGVLRADEVVTAAVVVMFGAIETTEGMIANALWHLLTVPGAWDTVRADRDRIADGIEESLRHEPAAAVVDRYARRDVELGDATIAAGDLVTISLLGANHDPAVFDDPEIFDLARANARQHVSFVQGPHGCLGLHLARMQTHAAVAGLLDHASDLELDPAASAGPRGLIFRKAEAVRVRWSAA